MITRAASRSRIRRDGAYPGAMVAWASTWRMFLGLLAIGELTGRPALRVDRATDATGPAHEATNLRSDAENALLAQLAAHELRQRPPSRGSPSGVRRD